MPPIRPHGQPTYANRAGDPCFPPPYTVDQAGMDIFLCNGNEDALGQMIDRALNIPTADQYGSADRLWFELASPVVGFACIDVKRLRSRAAPTRRAGELSQVAGIDQIYAHQTEVAVMVQVRDRTGMPYWYLPYVLNSLPTAVTTGREIYGYPKQYATFAGAGAPAGTESWPLFGPDRTWSTKVVVDTYDVVPRDNGEAEFALTPVLEFHQVTRSSGRQVGTQQSQGRTPNPDDFEFSPGRPFDGATPAGPSETVTTSSVPVAASRPIADEAGRSAADFLTRIRSDVPYVFLRQFREPAHETLASYQALVIGRLVPDAEDNLRIDDATFRIAMPWAYNLALAEQVFGAVPQPRETVERAVVGLLTGRNATFDVLRAAILWQFGSDDATAALALNEFMEWRTDYLAHRSADAQPLQTATPEPGI